jgi:hypothetical protein
VPGEGGSMLEKLGKLFSRYPNVPCVRPNAFAGMTQATRTDAVSGVIAVQSVPDKLYFLLFGAVRAHLAAYIRGPAELVVVRAVSGAIGTGPLAEAKRSAVFAWLLGSQWTRAYGPLVDGVAYRCATWAHPFRDVADWLRSLKLWKQLQHHGADISLQIDGIEVGDLLIDSYLRFKPSPEFDVSDPFVRRLVWQALRDVRQAHGYFGRVKPRTYLTSYTTYLEHGIPARVALHHGVSVWSFGSLSRFGKKLSLADTYHTPDFSGYRRVFESLDAKDDRLMLARQQLENRLSGGIDAATSYMRQSAYGKSDDELPANLNGAVVVFLHDFYDSPHVYPELVFIDFWQWICFTIDVLQASGVNFFLKPHPNQIALSDQALARLRAQYPNLQWLPSGCSNLMLVRAGVACGVTVYGTVAHELAYLGVPSIACARHPHHTFDFCRTAKTCSEYEGMLKNYVALPIPNEEMRRQALAFYYMHNLYGDTDALALRQLFLSFWKACNVDGAKEQCAIDAFSELVNSSEFNRFVKAFIQERQDQ